LNTRLRRLNICWVVHIFGGRAVPGLFYSNQIRAYFGTRQRTSSVLCERSNWGGKYAGNQRCIDKGLHNEIPPELEFGQLHAAVTEASDLTTSSKQE
jgi:hypothetical protein